ncbi:MAG TPA: DUF4147 domain-containing protein [Alphaproteobacteria bacterium]|nr:DUF4147 domain-containing protein [Alphaproteobacteria bacterium]
MLELVHVRNASMLLSHGREGLRRDAIEILDYALTQVSPYVACRKQVRLVNNVLTIGEASLSLPAASRAWFFGVGKASLEIARAVEEIFGDRLEGGLVVCKEGQTGRLDHIDIMHASHPIPSEASVEAAKEMIRRVAEPVAGDVVIFGITGGSSALMTLPCDGLRLSDAQCVTETLLTCGADIFEINAVRKHLSKVGGGRLALHLNPEALLVNLTVSDVIGDALDYITDPTVPDTSTLADARATFDKFDLWTRVPERISALLRDGGLAETPKHLPKPRRHDRVLLSSSAICEAARAKAEALGYSTMILSSCFDGESQALGQNFAALAREIVLRKRPLESPCAIIGGGETVVHMHEFAGSGGPNQEFALNGARYLPAGRPAVLLGADSDGTDGPTEVAGALCDDTTVERAGLLGVDIAGALRRHDVTPALLRLEDAIITGATGTNVNDLKLLLLA